ncbi:hypothetical protein AcW1_010162 [Taiwanofungus camphoratus]|nr:hypothetical protein AcW1_010162 [Antrodia cinnamomea]
MDFQKGERQMNMDYSLSNAIRYNTKDIDRMLLLYDINCQYGQYLLKQFQQNPYLQMPKGLKIVKGISLFIPGASLVDGEILKTLWSSLNKVSGSTRGMATSHQKEVLNRHMNDSNWKKIINTVSSLQRKYKNIKPILTDIKKSYQAMEASIDPTLLVQWKQQMRKAQQHWLKNEKAMDIFDMELRKAPSQANIQLRLAKKEPHLGLSQEAVGWLTQGLKVQETQISLAAEVRSMGQNLTTQQKIQLMEKRKKLQMRINSFESQRSRYMAGLMDDNGEEWEDEVLPPDKDLGQEWDVTEMDNPFEVPSSQGVNPEMKAEYSSLSLPSTTRVDRCHQAGLQVLLQQEMDLREGQANNALHQIWIAIRKKSFLFHTKVCNAKSQQRKTRAWQDVNTIDKTLQHHARVYSKTQKALVLLEAPADLLAKYQVLHREHLKVSTAVADPNERGERGASPPWFWTMDIQGESDTDSYMQEYHHPLDCVS